MRSYSNCNSLERRISKTNSNNPEFINNWLGRILRCGDAKMIEEDGAKIIWVALGAPKQEKFMNKLLPYLKSGVMIAVGAAFKFYSGTDEKRCPKWIQKHHLEFVYRILQDPKKQLKCCFWIVYTLPGLYLGEVMRKRKNNGILSPISNMQV